MGKEKEYELEKESKMMDIFEESAKEVLDTTNATVVSPVISERNLDPTSASATVLQAKNWNELASCFENQMTQRFMEVVNKLPDREYVRVFTKIAPFFKQKASINNNVSSPVMNQITIKQLSDSNYPHEITNVSLRHIIIS